MTDNTLPKAVRDQIEAANALQKQITEPESKPAEAQAAPAPAGDPAPAPAPALAPAPAADSDEGNWRQKYLTLQGLFNQKLPEAQRAAQTATANVQALQQQLAAAQAELEKARAERPPLVTDEDKAVFGDDLLGVVAKQARQELQPEIDQMKATIDTYAARNAQLEALLAGQAQTVQKSLQQQFYDALDAGSPDWERVNRDPLFLAWLGEYDPGAGTTRMQVLQQQFAAMNAQGVLHFFNAFSQAKQAPRAASVPADMIDPPRTSAGTQAPSAPAKRQWKRAEISQFYADRAAGRYAGKEAEAKAIEADLFSAGAEGRIVD